MPFRCFVWLLAMVPCASAAPFALGANFNENLHAACLPALDATGVKWIRGFLPATEFIEGPRRLASDPALATFRAAAASGRRVALSLKWDFRRAQTRVPAPDSAQEQACFAWALEVAQFGRPDLLLLINEIFIDTPEEDLLPGPDGAIPMVRFLQRLAAHVHAAGLKTPDGAPLPVSCGGFTRMDRRQNRELPATRALLPWLASTPHLTHVNYHLHQQDLTQFAAAAGFMRAHLPKRPLVVTEFSLVWAFQQAAKDTLGSTAAGRAFAEKFHHRPDQTVFAYLDAAALQPVPEEELHAFLASRTWFDPRSLEGMCELMERNGVVLATFAYLQESSGLENPRRKLGGQQPPWRLNPVFQERHAFVPGADRLAVNLGYHETFVRHQHPSLPR
jgi:hypothetical protein